MENSGKMIGALLLGAAIGGALGILFAPDKGSETRKKIAGKTSDLTDSVKEKLDEVIEEAKSKFEAAKENFAEFADHGKG
ncbi:MAG: YtxH domain-containing protein [Bacteroidota bacterium]|nr:YtxH domain-containing protein [Bacteroidota bacterium]